MRVGTDLKLVRTIRSAAGCLTRTYTGGAFYAVGVAAAPPTSRFATPTFRFVTPTFVRFSVFWL